MSANSFRFNSQYSFSVDEIKSIFDELGIIREVCDDTIHMERWTKRGEHFRNELLERGTVRYGWDDGGRLRRSEYFICLQN